MIRDKFLNLKEHFYCNYLYQNEFAKLRALRALFAICAPYSLAI